MLHDGGWPVIVLSSAGIIDVEEAEGAVVAAMNAPGYRPAADRSLPGARIAAEPATPTSAWSTPSLRSSVTGAGLR